MKPIDFAALRGGPPVTVKFAHGGAIYDQYYQGIGASCGDDRDEGSGD